MELRTAEKTLENYDYETIRDFFSFSASDVQEALLFLERLLTPTWGAPDANRQRAMLAALSLHGRVLDIQDELREVGEEELALICDNGYSAMAENYTLERSKTVVRAIARDLQDKKRLRKEILRMDLLREVVYKISGRSAESLSSDELYKALCKL